MRWREGDLKITYVGDHNSAGIASKWVLQEASEFRITVRNMRAFVIHKGRDDIAQSR